MEKSKISLPKFILLSTIFCLLSTGLLGCATYKFHHGKAPHNKGYVVSRDDYTILEYTLGKDDSVPNLRLAKERFKRRRDTVEYYYKKMGIVENHLKMAFWDPAVFFLKMVGGVFRLPFVAVSQHRYEHNPKYRERIKKIEAEKDSREEARIKKLKDELNVYIQKELTKESLILEQAKTLPLVTTPPITSKPEEEAVKPVSQPQPTQQAVTPAPQPQPIQEVVPQPEPRKIVREQTQEIPEQKPAPVVEKKQTQVLTEGISTVIVAKPAKGYSPLKVKFDGRASHSKYGKIISYYWEFGDGETSTKPNPVNTYWSGTFQPKYFIVNLMVKDDKGRTAAANTTIEVLNR